MKLGISHFIGFFDGLFILLFEMLQHVTIGPLQEQYRMN